jgi:hypothetical protein
MKPLRPTRGVATLLGVAFYLLSGVAGADVPTSGDMAACNQEAREGSRDRSASPTTKDEGDAEAARRARPGTTAPPGSTTAATKSEDPQIHGMDGQGATDAAYRAAYRVCMRRRGF